MLKLTFLLLSASTLLFSAFSVPALVSVSGTAQSCSARNGSTGLTVSCTLPNAVTAGNTLIVSAAWCDTGTCTSVAAIGSMAVSDSRASSFSQAVCLNAGGTAASAACTFSAHLTSSGADTITVTISGGTSAGTRYLVLIADEWSGIATASRVDQTGTNTLTTANPSVATAGATTQSGELIYAFISGLFGPNSGTITQGAGYTSVTLGGSAQAYSLDEYKIGSATQSETAPFVAGVFFADTGYNMLVSTFNPAIISVNSSIKHKVSQQ